MCYKGRESKKGKTEYWQKDSFLNRVIREKLTVKVALELKPKGSN